MIFITIYGKIAQLQNHINKEAFICVGHAMQLETKDQIDLIKLENVSFSRGKHVIYDNVTLNIPKGKITAIMGPSGTGKTTLLRLIGGQLLPQAGSIWYQLENDQKVNIPTLSRSKLFQLRKRMSMLFQNGALFTGMSVLDNVIYPLKEHTKLPPELLRTLALMKLETVGLRGARDKMPAELSGGMARRAALARSIALDPELIMYDEPFTGQDPITMAVLLKLIKRLNDTLGITSIIVSHDVEEVMSISDYVYIIANTKILASGTPKSILENKDPNVYQFIHGVADGSVPFHYPANDYFEDL